MVKMQCTVKNSTCSSKEHHKSCESLPLKYKEKERMYIRISTVYVTMYMYPGGIHVIVILVFNVFLVDFIGTDSSGS